MKKSIVSVALYAIYIISLSLFIDKVPYWLWTVLELVGINTYNMITFIATSLIIASLIGVAIWGGYIILRQLIKSEREPKRFCGIFLLCLVISVSAFNILQADIPGIYFKTTETVKVYTEPTVNSTPITISRDVLGDTVDADFRYGKKFLGFESGSYLHKALNIENQTKLYLPEAYARSYSYTIG